MLLKIVISMHFTFFHSKRSDVSKIKSRITLGYCKYMSLSDLSASVRLGSWIC